jgi:hypothetical protein
MTPNEIRQWASENTFYSKYGNRKWCEKHGHIDLHESVITHTSFLNAISPTFAVRYQCIVSGITSLPKCDCGTNLRPSNSPDRIFTQFCSTKCAANNKEHISKRDKTNLERYGNKNPAKSEIIRNKISDSLTKDVPFDDIVEDAKKHYHDRFIYKLDDRTVVVTCKEHNEGFTPRIQDLRNGKTNCPVCRASILSKKYIMTHDQFVANLKLVKGDDITIVDEYKGSHVDATFKCSKHGEFVKKPYQLMQDQNCPLCYSGTSKKEEEIVNFVSSLLDYTPLTNSRRILPSGKEIDIYCQQHNLMIEYNGIYWHSNEVLQNKNYHKNKTKEARELGCNLFHIWSTDWDTKQDIVKSMIKSKLGLSERVYARKCSIVELTSSEYREFMDKNHLQGSCNASVRLGLVYDGSVVASMSFSKPRFSTKYEYELIRYANALGRTVVGAASRLFKHFVTSYSPKSVISYSDASYSNGNLYSVIGFTNTGWSAPNYVYTKDFINMVSRYSAQKHKLASFLNVFDPNKSEAENMAANKYFTVYDCGSESWEWHNV